MSQQLITAIFSCVTQASIAYISTHQFQMERFCESSLTAEVKGTVMTYYDIDVVRICLTIIETINFLKQFVLLSKYHKITIQSLVWCHINIDY